MKTNSKPGPEETKILVATASRDLGVAEEAMAELAVAIETPLRQGVLNGDNLGGIFAPIDLTRESGARVSAEFPIDFLAPGTEKEHVAYTIPNHGYIPQRHVEGDYVQVPTYDIGSAIDWNIKYARDARWDIVTRANEVFRAGFTKKMNDDGWQVIISAGYDRNVVVYDSDAANGQFTKRLVSLGKTVMRRNGGGNSTSVNRGKMSHLFLSPEGIEDIRNWNVDQVDEVTRREIFVADEGVMSRIFGVNLVDIDELGEGQEYQDYYATTLGGSMPAGDTEICVGLDLTTNNSFVMPVTEDITVNSDPNLLRSRRAGIYGWAELGFACLDNRRVILLSY
jgi:hypothetical protein